MRAKYECKKTHEEWLKDAIAVNPFVTQATFALPDRAIQEIARQAGEEIK